MTDRGSDGKSSTTTTNAAQARPAVEPFGVNQLIGLGDWQLMVSTPTTTNNQISVPVRLLNKSGTAKTLPADGLFALRDGQLGADIAPTVTTGLGGSVKANGDQSGSVVFLPGNLTNPPILYFHGEKIGALPAYIALTDPSAGS